jgi:hypothetical protein
VSRYKGIRGFRSKPGLAALLALTVLLLPKPVQAQTPAPAPAPAPEPPPRLEASAQFAFLNTRGNADTQSHTLRYSAAPPEGFEKTDTIMAVSLVAKVQRPR